MSDDTCRSLPDQQRLGGGGREIQPAGQGSPVPAALKAVEPTRCPDTSVEHRSGPTPELSASDGRWASEADSSGMGWGRGWGVGMVGSPASSCDRRSHRGRHADVVLGRQGRQWHHRGGRRDRIVDRATGPAGRPRRRPPIGVRPPEPSLPGIHDWVLSDATPNRLIDLAIPVVAGVSLVWAGLARAPANTKRWQALGAALGSTRRNRRGRRRHPATRCRRRAADRSLLVTRARYLSLRLWPWRHGTGRPASCSSVNRGGRYGATTSRRRSARRSRPRSPIDPSSHVPSTPVSFDAPAEGDRARSAGGPA